MAHGWGKTAAAFLHAHQKWLAIAAAGLCVVIAGLLALLVFSAPENAASGLAPVLSEASAGLSAAQSLPAGEDAWVPTVLPETADAGMAYAEETLFLGDSNTERMLYYSDVTGVTVTNGFGVAGMGISTFTTTAAARFLGVDGSLTMPQVVALLQPRRVVMTFGTNNVGMNVERFVDDYKTAVAAVKAAYPYTDIIVGSIFPVDQYRQNTSITMERITAMNEALTAMCEELDIKFLSWGDAIYDEATGYSLFESTIQDGAHLSRAGMTAIFNYFRTHSYITADRRPTPLAAVPQRIAQQPAVIAQDGRKQAGPVDWDAIEAAQSPVTVVFGTWDETNNTAGGGSVSPGSVSVKPGGTSGTVTATPMEGYTFVGWSFDSGASGGSTAAIGVTVGSDVPGGTTLTVTAVFRQAAASSTSASSSTSDLSSLPPEQPQSPEPAPDPPAENPDPGAGGESAPDPAPSVVPAGETPAE